MYSYAVKHLTNIKHSVSETILLPAHGKIEIKNTWHLFTLSSDLIFKIFIKNRIFKNSCDYHLNKTEQKQISHVYVNAFHLCTF